MAAEQLITRHLDLWTAAIKRRSTAGRGSSSKIELYGIKKLRELILELAVRGLLVPQDPKDEPASELLKKIAAEKAKLVKAGKVKQGKALPTVSGDGQQAAPSGWSWTCMAELGEIRKRCDPNIGDVLISCSGSVGRVALVDRNNAYAMVRSAAMVRPVFIRPGYLALCLRSPALQEQMVAKETPNKYQRK